ncbi:MAG TPA: flagellar filament capping protein FliD [Candidatus Binatus sp.]|nr:flagellar filament capping protein FliD [Candidatus Binatus sp.]
MAGLITVGGLATGLDSNKIIDQLMKLERRPIDLLENEKAAAQATKASVATVGSKLTALGTAVRALTTVGGVLVRSASSSDEGVLTAAAGAGAARGSLTVTVGQLARGSTAGSTVGLPSATATVASGTGSFRFQVGSGAVQTVNVGATTTLQGLAGAINDLGAGVTATAVNLGTTTSPDYRLQIVSDSTGSASTIAVVQDDTSLAVQATQAGQDASFTVSGFSGTFARSTNSFSDVLPGVTISLKSEGTSTVTVSDDPDKIVEQVKAVVTAFNDIVGFVAGESTVTESKDKKSVTLGTLATDSAVRRVLQRLHEVVSEPFAGASGRYVNLSSVGLATQKDGTLKLDEAKLRGAVGNDPTAVAELFAGTVGSAGIADDLTSAIDRTNGTGGVLATHDTALDQRIQSLQDQIDSGNRRLDKVEANLRAQFTALETLVSSLQSQSGFLLSALGAK